MSSPVKFIDNRQYHKSNYNDALRYIVPSLYFEEDYALKDEKIDILDQVINSHLNVIGNISSIINVSSIPNTTFSALNKPAGISKFFVKQNNLTEISIDDFEKNILVPLGTSLRNFNSSSEFSDYINNTLLPGIKLNAPTLTFGLGSASAAHNYLISNLSWLYFLNLSGPPTLAYNPSSYVHDVLVSKTYISQDITLADGIKGLATYLWNNYSLFAGYNVIPSDFRPASYVGDAVWTSGTQQLDKLLTLIDVVYSPLYIDDGDTRVMDAVTDYLENSYLITNKKLQGPFLKLLKAFSFAFADYSNKIDRLEVLNDIDECPDEYLPHLADLIGWKLFGSDPTRWRLQIANAIEVYKSVGTKKSIQFVANAVFGKDVFDVSSNIYELWESYVPFLIYYALATESTLLKDFSTWTQALALRLGCGYSENNMDQNIRSCVDKIILDLVSNFKNQFLLGGKPFPLDSEKFVFNYRDKINKVPPFEEIPYYTNVIITEELLNAIEDKLFCFGVPIEFATKVSDYIRQRTLLSADDYSIKNSWLLFTSAMEYPPNWDSVVQDISNSRIQYLDLWNGKSSHFQVLLDASSFNFAKTSLEADSKEVLKIVGQTVQEFSPAKSVADVIARLNAEDNYTLSDTRSPVVSLDKADFGQIKYTSAAGFAGFGMSALAMGTYKRGLTSTAVDTFKRWDADSVIDTLLSPNGTTANLPRRNHRRRDYKYLLKKEGFYDKTGFNVPAPLRHYASATTALYLGLVPSSQTYVPIPDFNNIPAIYNKCEGLSSTSIYSGLVVSNTFPIRGWTRLGTSAEAYVDFGQLDPFIAAIHSIKEKAKLVEASAYYYSNVSSYYLESDWKNVLQSYANSSTQLNGAFPNSFDDYIKFSLGREFHKLYYDYTHNFSRHRLIPIVKDLDGPTIFGHTFGSVLYNSKFKLNGSLTDQYKNLISSSLTDVPTFNSTNVFAAGASLSGTYNATSISQWPIEFFEYRNSGILKHIEFTQTSGSNSSNGFSIVRLDKNNKVGYRYNPLLHENTLIKQVRTDGFGRFTFDISKYQTDSNLGYDVSYNFLSPDHTYKLSIDSLICDNDGANFGGGSIGVWIHTIPENNKMWSYVTKKGWLYHDISSLTIADTISNYTNLFSFDQRARPTINQSTIICNRYLDPNNPNKVNDVLASLKSDDFNSIELEFNTENININVPIEYYDNVSQQLHRKSQKYVIEIFSNVSQNNKFTLFYNLNLIDSTLNKWSKPFITKIDCKEFRVDTSRDEVYSIIKYFNEINGSYSNFGYASRVPTYTSGVYETSGGSRINYVESPNWNTNTKNSYNLITTLTIKN